MIKRELAKMMKILCIGGLLATGLPLHADVELRQGEKRIEVAESTLSRMEEMSLEADYATPDTNDKNIVKEEFEEQGQYLYLDREVYNYPAALQQLATSPSSDMVEFQNGSVWQVNPRYVVKLSIWLPNSDGIVVMQDTSWFFSRYKYRLVNTATGDVVAADMQLGAFADRVPFIVDIDPNDRKIFLSDGTAWKISGWDDFIYHNKSSTDLKKRRWLSKDGIIVGANASYWGGPFILLNVNMNQVARARYLGRW